MFWSDQNWSWQYQTPFWRVLSGQGSVRLRVWRHPTVGQSGRKRLLRCPPTRVVFGRSAGRQIQFRNVVGSICDEICLLKCWTSILHYLCVADECVSNTPQDHCGFFRVTMGSLQMCGYSVIVFDDFISANQHVVGHLKRKGKNTVEY